ncbi:MAG TPA: secretin N-terminal domain-containing protein [Candidatus Limnocylindria bacterium]|nr:secretin N-terminal domain-containing protein [Candidatus Limnocylindria bacterium]
MKQILAAAVVALTLAVAHPTAAQNDRFTFEASDVDLADAIRLLGAEAGRNVVADGSIRPQRVRIRLADVSFDEALATLVTAYGLQTHRDGRILIVGDASSMNRRFPDDGTPGGTLTRVFVLAHAYPEELVSPLQSALPQGTLVVGDKRTGTLVITGSAATIARARQLVAALDAPTGVNATLTIPLHNLRASEALKALKGAVPESALFADDRQNVVVVSGNAELQEIVRTILQGLDAPGRQVMFEVRVADVEPTNDTDNVGIEYGGVGFGTGAQAQFPYTVIRSAFVVNAQINTLVQRGRASILAEPRVATLNNHEASLLVGEQYPVVTVNQQTGYPSVQTIDVGVRLRLTPTIGAEGSITAELHPEFSQIIGFNNGFPIIANRKVDATLRVHDGETIVLGGLFQDIDSDTVTKLPFLGDLPVLGGVFRNRQRSHTKDEIVFFITPRILGADGKAPIP